MRKTPRECSLEFQRREDSVFLNANADRTRRAFRRDGHFDPHLLSSPQTRNVSAFGDKKQDWFLTDCDDRAIVILVQIDPLG